MRYVTSLGIGSLLAGCGESDDDLAAEMERALRESNTALAVALASVEILSNVTEEPDTQLRHSGLACGCPCTERIGPEGIFAVNLDYTGCYPDSGLFPGVMAGHASLQGDGASVFAIWSDLLVSGDLAAGGTLEAGLATDGDVQIYDLTGEPTFGEVSSVLDLRVEVRPDGLGIDGTVAVGRPRATVEFALVDLPWDEIRIPCPVPVEGTAILRGVDHDDTVVRYAKPGDGLVTAAHRERVSEGADYCAYASDLL